MNAAEAKSMRSSSVEISKSREVLGSDHNSLTPSPTSFIGTLPTLKHAEEVIHNQIYDKSFKYIMNIHYNMYTSFMKDVQ